MSQRIYLLDNIKVYLMLLVIVAHTLIASYGHNDKLIAWIWFFCLSYTMPLFTFISGFLSRPAWELKKNVRHLLIPFMVFSVVNICYEGGVNENFNFDWTVPGFAMWYLLVLFLYRLILPLLVRIKYVFIYSLVLSWVVGYLPFINTSFSLSRFFCFLPFFLLGYYVAQKEEWKQKLFVPIDMKGVFSVILIFVVWFIILSYKPSLAFATSFTGGYGSGYIQILFRIFLQISVVMLGYYVLRLFPKGFTWITPYGSRTMNVYLLHALIVLPFAYQVFPLFEDGTVLQKVGMILIPTFCCLFLFTRPVDVIMKKII